MNDLTTAEIKDIIYVIKGFQSMSETHSKLKAELVARGDTVETGHDILKSLSGGVNNG